VLPSEGGTQEMVVIPISDVLRLITKSRMKEAQKVESWIFDEVMTKVIKTGQYSQISQPQLPSNYIEALKALVTSEEARERAEKKINILTHVTKTYTATEIAKEIGMKSATALNEILEEKRIQYKVNDTWVLYSNYADKGLTITKQEQLDNGTIVYYMRWTQIGREFLL
jgi:prophage antirepressor-like protein